jgi:hypothetical protein
MQQIIAAEVITFYGLYILLGHGQLSSDQYFAAKQIICHINVVFGARGSVVG